MNDEPRILRPPASGKSRSRRAIDGSRNPGFRRDFLSWTRICLVLLVPLIASGGCYEVLDEAPALLDSPIPGAAPAP